MKRKYIERACDTAEKLRKRHDLSEAQEHVLRGLLLGLPDVRLRDFDGKRMSLKTIQAHRETIMEQIGWFGRLEYKLVRWLAKRELKTHFRNVMQGGVPSQA